MPKLYILKNKTPVEVDSFQEWAEWFDSADKRLMVSGFLDVRLKTVFVGLDHQPEKERPLLFISIVILPDGSQTIMRRYSTWAEAEMGHFEVFGELKEVWRANRELSRAIVERLAR